MPVDKTYEKEFRDSLAALPGGKAFRAAREKGLEGFLSLGGIPHARAEDWRYAPIGALRQAHIPRAAKGKAKTPAVKGVTGWPMAVLHNGVLVETPGIDGMEVLSSAEALPAWAAGFGAAGIEANPLERLNLALTDGMAFQVERDGNHQVHATPLPGTDLWDEVSDQVVTEDWELFDITHSVLPTKLPLEEFYREFAGLWQHAVDVRYRIHGRLKTHLGLVAALATGKVTPAAMRKGMRMGNVLARPESFLRAHRESPARLAEVGELAAVPNA